MNNESETGTAAKEEGKEETAAAISLLKTLREIPHNKIKKKQHEVHKTQNILVNDRPSIEINALQWVIAQSLSVRRLLTGEHSKLSYDTTITSKRN